MMNALIVYYSLGNNTKVTSELVKDFAEFHGADVDMIRINKDTDFKEINVENYDLIFIGSPSYGKGATPEVVKEFLRHLLKYNDFKLPTFAVFGTGDTQWGDLLYCRAVDEIQWHLEKKTNVINTLKIEQRPTSKLQISKINSFVELSMEGVRNGTIK